MGKKMNFALIKLFVCLITLSSCTVIPKENNVDPVINDDVFGVYEETLTAGYYIAGIDFPVGIYDLTAMSGMGNVIDVDIKPLPLNLIMSNPIQENITITSYKNANLQEGYILSITMTLALKIHSDNALISGLKSRSNTATKSVELASGSYVVGKDFDPGTYDITALKGMGNVYMLDSLFYGLNAIMGNPVQEGFSINSYHGVMLNDGYTLTISGVTLKLEPSK